MSEGVTGEAEARRLFRGGLTVTIVALLVTGLSGGYARHDGYVPRVLVDLTTYLADRQDLPVVLLAALFLGLCFGRPLAPGRARPALPGSVVVGVLAAVTLGLWLLRILIFQDHDLSRDEQMVRFDQQIFTSGRLFQPIPPELRPLHATFNTSFTLPIGGREGWVSGYLPVNAALRAAAEMVLPAALVSALFVFIAGLALWRIARRIWPEDGTTQAVVLLCFLASSQVLLMGTTRFAMAPHLALNLVWLLLFLQHRWPATIAAIGIGFLAMGLHQPLFHPLFVAPFLLLLLRERRWPELATYVVGYGAIGLFWLAWPGWVSALGSGPVIIDRTYQGVTFLERLERWLHLPTATSFLIMAANLARFMVWQFLLLVPLAVVGFWSGRRDPFVQALAAGIALLVVTMTLLLPAQGHGWGYRYLHGLIGSFCLLAGFGWRWMAARRAAPVQALAMAAVASILLLLPAHIWMMRGLVVPFATASRAIDRIDTDFVVIDQAAVPFGQDLVINRADLTNRPLRLSAAALTTGLIEDLCPGPRIAFVNGRALVGIARAFGVPDPGDPRPRTRALRARAVETGCRVFDVDRF